MQGQTPHAAGPRDEPLKAGWSMMETKRSQFFPPSKAPKGSTGIGPRVRVPQYNLRYLPKTTFMTPNIQNIHTPHVSVLWTLRVAYIEALKEFLHPYFTGTRGAICLSPFPQDPAYQKNGQTAQNTTWEASGL